MARKMLTYLLKRSGRDPHDFLTSFDNMIVYLDSAENVELISKELEPRGVKVNNFYDVALDYLLIDSFEDLESPPSSVLAVMRNRWLSDGFKESALSTAVWGVLQAKRRMMVLPNGFKVRLDN